MTWLWIGLGIFLVLSLFICGALVTELLRVACGRGVPSISSTRAMVDTVIANHIFPSTGLILDLGCGYGWTLRRLSKSGLRGPFVGYENVLVQWLIGRVWNFLTQSQVTIVHADLYAAPIESARGIYLFLLPSVLKSLGPELIRRAAPGTRILCAEFPLPGWQPLHIYEARGITSSQAKLFVYEVPRR